MISPMSRALALLLAAALCPSFALNPGRKLWHYGQSQWQDKDGLPQNTVLAIAQTADGYLWVATEGGLARFNGRSFHVFDGSNTAEFTTNGVTALAASGDGGLWVGTRRGLLHYRNGRFQRPPASLAIAHEQIRFLTVDDQGVLWIGGASGIARWADGGVSYPLRLQDGLPADGVRSFLKRGDSAWVGTIRGMGRFEGTSFAGRVAGVAPDTIRAMVIDRQQRFWVGTENRGLFLITRAGVQRYTSKDGLGSDSVRTLLEDRDGNLWIGTIGGGLSRWSGGKFESFSTADGLASNHVRSLFEDREGTLWVGLEGGGLLQLRDGHVLTLTRRDGLASDFIRAVRGGRDGALWIGTEGEGLFRYQDGRVKRAAALGLPKALVTALHEDSRGRLWVGTEGNGAYCLSGQGRRSYSTATGISEDSAWAIDEDPAGSIWIGTSNGLMRIRDGETRVFRREDGLRSNAIRALHAARDGSIWIGFHSGGLQRFQAGEAQVPPLSGEFGRVSVNSMYEDAGGTLWIATTSGLFRWKDGAAFHFTTRQGLFSDVLYQVLEDGDGRLWFGSSRGIFAVVRRELDHAAAGRAGKVSYLSFTTADGMKSSECSGDAQPAGWRSEDGSLWFSTIRGVIRIHPGELTTNRIPPSVRIERVEVNGEAAPSLSSAASPPGNRLLTVHFAALTFTAPGKVKFRYRLAGVDGDWVEVTDRSSVTYHNLPPGRHEFHVSAANGDGVWSVEDAALAVEVKPFFTQTAWFYGGCALALLAAAFWLHQRRARELRSRFAAVLAERTRIAREIHDTLLQGFAGVTLQLGAISRKIASDPVVARKEMEDVLDQVDGCLAEARSEIVQLRSMGPEAPFVPRMRRTVEAAAAGGSLQVKFSAKGAECGLGAEIERNLIRIASEAVANAVRHSQAEAVWIQLEFRPDSVRLSVRDDGAGLRESDPAREHFGLAGMRERTELLGGRFSIHGEAGRGTGIEVQIPLGEAV
jgi:ligand-binding sensor domain-containing protein/signal transduction histidine kinase